MATPTSLITTAALGSIVVTGTLSIHLVENYGRLATDGDIELQSDGDRLVGDYADALTAMSAVVVVLAFLYILYFAYHSRKYRGTFSDMPLSEKLHKLMILLSVLLGVTSSGLNLNLTENFSGVENLEVTTDRKLRGSYGKAVLGMSAASAGVSGITLAWMGFTAIGRMQGDTNQGSRYRTF